MKPLRQNLYCNPIKRCAGQAQPVMLLKGVLAVILLVWIASSLASVFWRLMPKPELEGMTLAADPASFSVTQQQSKPSVDISKLKSVAVFGKEEAPPKQVATPKVVEPEKLEPTKLNLELVGSFATENPADAYAIISNGRTQTLYKVDDDLEGVSNVKLVQVFPDRVVLNNRGQQEILPMYPEGKPLSSSAVAISPELSSANDNESSESESGNSLASLTPGERLEKISDVIRFSRKTENGKMIGFRVLPGRNRQAFEQTGLQLNDVVTAIDGQVIDNLRTANEIYQEKRNATQANLTIIRGEEEMTIDVDLNNINVN